MTPRIDTRVELSDQRRLAYADWGLLPDNPFPSGMRIIAPDRPVYGKSDPKLRRTHLDWANDVAELEDL